MAIYDFINLNEFLLLKLYKFNVEQICFGVLHGKYNIMNSYLIFNFYQYMLKSHRSVNINHS